MSDPATPPPEPTDPTAPPPGWTMLPDEHLPIPTFWPAGLALAVTLIFWGLVSSIVILVAGIVLLAVSLFGWIKQLRHERHPAR